MFFFTMSFCVTETRWRAPWCSPYKVLVWWSGAPSGLPTDSPSSKRRARPVKGWKPPSFPVEGLGRSCGEEGRSPMRFASSSLLHQSIGLVPLSSWTQNHKFCNLDSGWPFYSCTVYMQIGNSWVFCKARILDPAQKGFLKKVLEGFSSSIHCYPWAKSARQACKIISQGRVWLEMMVFPIVQDPLTALTSPLPTRRRMWCAPPVAHPTFRSLLFLPPIECSRLLPFLGTVDTGRVPRLWPTPTFSPTCRPQCIPWKFMVPREQSAQCIFICEGDRCAVITRFLCFPFEGKDKALQTSRLTTGCPKLNQNPNLTLTLT